MSLYYIPMKYFETNDKYIINLYNDYLFLKYYETEVLNDLQSYKPNVYNNFSFDNLANAMDRIKTYLNKNEYNRYLNIIKSSRTLFRLCGYTMYYRSCNEYDYYLSKHFFHKLLSLIKHELYQHLNSSKQRLKLYID
jgi:hypothetical protein